MKKLLSLALAAALVALAGSPVLAGVKNSRHDMADPGNTYTALIAFNKYGTCSACHVPHGAGGERLFPSTQPAAVGAFFAPLCGSCHDSAVVNNVNVAYDLTVLNSSHGYMVASLPEDGDLAGSGLPYTTVDATGGNTNIECLSCHDVHNQNSERPFLEVDLDDLCERCHVNRVNNTLTNIGYANRGTAPTTHPAGPLFSGNVSGGGSPIVWGALLDNNVVAQMAGGSTWSGKAPWNSGMHLSGQNVAGTGGVDCITCHNVHWDEERGVQDQVTDYLGLTQDGASGDTANANLFCEYCHQGSNQPPGGGTAGAYFWNPGSTLYSHPNDDIGASSTAVNVDLTWRPTTTFSPINGPAAGSGLTCTGCHGVHVDGAKVEVMPNTPIILNYTATSAVNPCMACHSSLGINHHPIGGSYATSGNTVNNLTCNGGNINVGVPTCHGNGGTSNAGAHNRTSPMAPVTNYSQMCVACHTVNPSVYTPATATPYTASQTASHFIGDATTAFPGGTGAGPRTTNDGSGGIVSPAWSTGLSSVYLAGDGMICESCHSLKANNLMDGDGETQMLLEVVGSDIVMGTGFASSPYLCTGCHGIPAGTHPLDEADPAVWPISGTQNAGLSFTADGLNCESCHSAHDANTQSGSYILDTTTVFNAANTNGMAVEPPIDYADFCGQCHLGFK